ncbi:hypothetical protein GQ55_6G050900 [Panicum hallii var. hallii]|uniref:Uncharacterized protein n=1 Tax=Panicum hallii var. hallii TaxID=1504633 RepID=A0A2T7D403_9POAL|nr:hypothetical protein GQ55_6G050900 [Panicum hallii var. hallii]
MEHVPAPQPRRQAALQQLEADAALLRFLIVLADPPAVRRHRLRQVQLHADVVVRGARVQHPGRQRAAHVRHALRRAVLEPEDARVHDHLEARGSRRDGTDRRRGKARPQFLELPAEEARQARQVACGRDSEPEAVKLRPPARLHAAPPAARPREVGIAVQHDDLLAFVVTGGLCGGDAHEGGGVLDGGEPRRPKKLPVRHDAPRRRGEERDALPPAPPARPDPALVVAVVALRHVLLAEKLQDSGRHGQVVAQDELTAEHDRRHGHVGLLGRQVPDRALLVPDLDPRRSRAGRGPSSDRPGTAR